MGVAKQLLDCLAARDMLQDQTEGLKSWASTQECRAYVGFDPTASSLHIGNLATLMLLVQAQRLGCRPVVLLGGATAMVGDPSGKTRERPLLEESIIQENEEQLRQQLKRFLDFEGPYAAEMYNNYTWLKGLPLLHFLRDVAKHFPVGYLLAKESTRSRLEQGLSFTEFSYQLLQAYDFYFLYKEYGVQLQMGGSDQWGNITAGIELIRRALNVQAYGLTTPLITRSDGSKFGKSEGENIWLDASRTSPYAFYQFWYNQEDADCEKLARVFTLRKEEPLKELQHTHKKAPHLRHMQRAIAEDVTSRVHGEALCRQAIEASELLFGSHERKGPLVASPQAYALLTKEIPYAKVPYTALNNIYTLLCEAPKGLICASRSELRRLMQSRGISINGTLLSASTHPQAIPLAHERYLLVRRGKKHFYVLEVRD